MDQDTIWYEGRTRLGDIVYYLLDGDPVPQWKEAQSPHFSAHVYCGKTVAHLSYCCALVNNKSSAAAEMGDRGHNKHGPKRGKCCAPFAGTGGELGPRLTQCGLG